MELNQTKCKKKRFDRNQLIFYCVIGILSILTGVIFIRNQKLQLKQPVFLRNCAEVYLQSDEEIGSFDQQVGLHYFTDINDKRWITSIEFEEYPEIECYPIQTPFDFFEESDQNQNHNGRGQIFGPYQLRKVTVTFNDCSGNKPSIVKISKAIIHFNDGSKEEVDLGEINLYPWRERKDIFDELDAWGFHNNQMTYPMKLKKQTKILRFDSILGDRMVGIVKSGYEDSAKCMPILWNQELPAPLENLENAMILIDSKTIQKEFPEYDDFCIRPMITVEQSGRKRQYSLDKIEFTNRFEDYKQVLQYLKKRGAFNGK